MRYNKNKRYTLYACMHAVQPTNHEQATFALLEEGRPKRWDAHFTGGKTVTLNVPKLCVDSGDIKVTYVYMYVVKIFARI